MVLYKMNNKNRRTRNPARQKCKNNIHKIENTQELNRLLKNFRAALITASTETAEE